jgi:hypothetical protein
MMMTALWLLLDGGHPRRCATLQGRLQYSLLRRAGLPPLAQEAQVRRDFHDAET